jgi:hypothetical protein
MPQLGNISVSIVNPNTGTKFEEYKVSKGGRKMERYIESKAGQNFKVVIQLHQGDKPVKETYKIHLEIDGETVGGGHTLGRQRGQFVAKAKFKGNRLGSTKIAPFLFADTKFTGLNSLFQI